MLDVSGGEYVNRALSSLHYCDSVQKTAKSTPSTEINPVQTTLPNATARHYFFAEPHTKPSTVVLDKSSQR